MRVNVPGQEGRRPCGRHGRQGRRPLAPRGAGQARVRAGASQALRGRPQPTQAVSAPMSTAELARNAIDLREFQVAEMGAAGGDSRRASPGVCELALDARLKELVGDPEGQRRHREQRRSPPVTVGAQYGADNDQPDTHDKFHAGTSTGVAISKCSPWVLHDQGS